MAGDRPGEPAYEIFSIERTFLTTKVAGTLLSRITWALLKLLVKVSATAQAYIGRMGAVPSSRSWSKNLMGVSGRNPQSWRHFAVRRQILTKLVSIFCFSEIQLRKNYMCAWTPIGPTAPVPAAMTLLRSVTCHMVLQCSLPPTKVNGCKRVNCEEMDGDRPKLPANKNCYKLSRVFCALARISCFLCMLHNGTVRANS